MLYLGDKLTWMGQRLHCLCEACTGIVTRISRCADMEGGGQEFVGAVELHYWRDFMSFWGSACQECSSLFLNGWLTNAGANSSFNVVYLLYVTGKTYPAIDKS